AEFLSPDISAGDKEELKNKLMQAGYDKVELEDMDKLYSMLDEIEVPETSSKLDTDFYRSLELYKDAISDKSSHFGAFISSIFKKKYVLRFTYSLTLVVFGWYLGSWSGRIDNNNVKIQSLSQEISQMKQVMIYTMLEQPSATKRIKAISYTDEFENVDDKILNTFLDTLNNDPNPNVRLAAVEALSRFSDIQFVRKGLVKSILKQESPLVQVALIDLMLKLKEKASKKELSILLENRELNYSVWNKTRETIRLL
ncbi:MAG: HEAT repeat domain-containing protein, partial [Candidatus Aminicenantes bacterium]|nr:HEAT repeat domain-containing protein [Candidatus Aminicenantes bacterium]